MTVALKIDLFKYEKFNVSYLSI